MIDDKKIEEIAKQHAEGTFIQGAWQDCYKVDLLIVLSGCRKSS